MDRPSRCSLLDIWTTLNVNQKVSVAVQVGIFQNKAIQSQTFRCAGILDPEGSHDICEFPLIPRITMKYERPEPRASPGSAASTAAKLFDRRRTRDGTPCPYAKLSAMVADIDKYTNVLSSSVCYFVHRAVETRNFFAEIESPSSVRLTGVVGWETAVFAPLICACKAPVWLWAGEGEAVIKAAYEENISDELRQLAFAPEMNVVREALEFGMFGLKKEGMEKVEEMQMRWMQVRREKFGVVL